MNNKEIVKMLLMAGFMVLILYLLYKAGLIHLPFFKPVLIYSSLVL